GSILRDASPRTQFRGGAQGAARPRTGPSPPEQTLSSRAKRGMTRIDPNLLRPRQRTRAHHKEARHARASPACPSRPGPAQAPAKDLLRAIHAGDPEAVAELRERHPD